MTSGIVIRVENPGKLRYIGDPGRALSDSSTVQEECCIFHVPNVTLRDVTERPETLECGSNMLSGYEPEAILRSVEAVLAQGRSWRPPAEYLEADVSSKVVKIVLGYRY